MKKDKGIYNEILSRKLYKYLDGYIESEERASSNLSGMMSLIHNEYTESMKEEEFKHSPIRYRRMLNKLLWGEPKEIELKEIMNISQNSNSNVLIDMFPKKNKNRLSKPHYQVQVANDLFFVEYDNLKEGKEQYKTTVALKEIPSLRLLDSIGFIKFWDYLHLQINAQNRYIIEFKLDDFIKFIYEDSKNIKQKNKERIGTNVSKYVKILGSIQLHWVNGGKSSSKKKNETGLITLFPSPFYTNRWVSIGLDPRYKDSLKNNYFSVPASIGKTQNKNTYLVLRKIFLHAKMSVKNIFNLTMETLRASTGLPTYQEVVKKYKGDVRTKIKDPMDKILCEIREEYSEYLTVNFTLPDNDKFTDWGKTKININIIHDKIIESLKSLKACRNKKVQVVKRKTSRYTKKNNTKNEK